MPYLSTDMLLLLILLLLGAVLLALVIVRRPVIGLYLMMLLIPFEGMTVLIPKFTFIKVLGIVTFGAWFMGKAIRKEPIRGLSGYLIKPLLAFAFIAIVSVAWAQYRQAWLASIISLLQWMLLVLLVIDQITSWERLERLTFLLLPVGLMSMGLALYQFYVEGIRRAEGGLGTPTALAAIISAMLPFALHYVIYGSRLKSRVGLLYILMGIPTLTLTFARSAFLIVPLLFFLQAKKLPRPKRWKVVVPILIVGLLTMSIVPLDQVTARIQSVWLEVAEEHSPRILHWRGALSMFLDHPLLGVGFANYGYQFTYQYQFLDPDAFRVYRSPRAAHSSYLRMLAELGVVGFGAFISLLVVASRNITWAIIKCREVGTEPKRQLLISAALSWICYLSFEFFLSVEKDKLFWVVMAVTEVAKRLIEKEALPQIEWVG